MRALRALSTRIEWQLHGYEPRVYSLALARTVLASVTFVTIAVTPDRGLFAYSSTSPSGVRCDGLRGISLWCVAGPEPTGLLVARVVALLVLGVTAIGYRPRWTCVPHWYVTFGLAVSMTMANGSEHVSRVGTMLLIPICLGDRRVWQWSRPARLLEPRWRGSAYAAMVLLRLQIAIIYIEAAIAKMLVPQWRNGTAMYAVFGDPISGVNGSIYRFLGPAMDSRLVVGTLTWGALVPRL